MPLEPSAGVWGALFGACMIHKDFVLGEIIGKYLVEMQPFGSGGYALLANMYYCSQKWEESASLRITMKRRRVEKVRGCSFIEIDGVLHQFISSDESHPHSKGIYESLAAMAILMKLQWCPLDCFVVLFDMGVR
ncbi:uncharacterized protein A4U43_C01F10040 [Asparagus officinalis]|uniref:Pentatricopeptide repeat-containing protein n=1 Tax=Asparagus officinalis TaxID=4686 RepID=A0A5P1FP36_ASPOF|nr:uncharacterized protein A4U43_C01F10040 [Asparagus officinalis]